MKTSKHKASRQVPGFSGGFSHVLLFAVLLLAQALTNGGGANAQPSNAQASIYRDIELGALTSSCTVYSTGVVALNLSGSARVDGVTRNGTSSNFLDLAAIPWSQGLKEGWNDFKWAEWLTRNETRFSREDPPINARTEIVHQVALDVYDRLGREVPGSGSLTQAVVAAESTCIQIGLAVVIGRTTSDVLASGVKAAAISGSAKDLWEKTKGWWEGFLKSRWGQRILKWAGIIQIVDIWANCGACMEGLPSCNMWQCAFDLISLVLSLSPTGRMFALILDLINILCAFMEQTCAAVCEYLGWPQILPMCNDILREREEMNPSSF
jgi:hypothetical protein